MIEEALHEFGQESRAGWPGVAQSAWVVELAHITERAKAELLRAIGQCDAEGLWAEDGAASAASWLAANTAMTRAEALGEGWADRHLESRVALPSSPRVVPRGWLAPGRGPDGSLQVRRPDGSELVLVA